MSASGSKLVDYVLGAQLSFLNFFLVVLFWFPLLIWIGKEVTMGLCHSKKSLKGKVAIVTGANAGKCIWFSKFVVVGHVLRLRRNTYWQ